uniref:Uncharacterized protein n=1 Tax=Neovison vison TaxID=452646 RepID=A0A8C7C3K3_NEOVI
CDPRVSLSTVRRLPRSAERWRSSHSTPERPRSPAARTSLVFFLAGPLPQLFPTRRTAGDALPLLQLKFVATCRLPGFCRAEASTVSADWPGRLVLCSPSTSGCDVF